MNYLSKQFFTFSKVPLLFLFIDIFAMRYWGMRWAARLTEKIIFFLNLIKQKWIESVLCAWPILWAAGNTFRPMRAPPSCSPATVTTPALHPLRYHQCRLVGLSDLRDILSPTRYRSEVTPPNMKACGKSQRIISMWEITENNNQGYLFTPEDSGIPPSLHESWPARDG